MHTVSAYGDWTTKAQTLPGAQAFTVAGLKGPRTVWAYVQRWDNPWPEKRIESIVANRVTFAPASPTGCSPSRGWRHCFRYR